jgi:hypothetical protein
MIVGHEPKIISPRGGNRNGWVLGDAGGSSAEEDIGGVVRERKKD